MARRAEDGGRECGIRRIHKSTRSDQAVKFRSNRWIPLPTCRDEGRRDVKAAHVEAMRFEKGVLPPRPRADDNHGPDARIRQNLRYQYLFDTCSQPPTRGPSLRGVVCLDELDRATFPIFPRHICRGVAPQPADEIPRNLAHRQQKQDAERNPGGCDSLRAWTLRSKFSRIRPPRTP